MEYLYETIYHLDSGYRNILATLISGEYAGEQMLLSEGKVLYPMEKSTMLKAYSSKIEKVKKSGIVLCENQSVFCDIITGEKKMIICGAGHVSMPMIKIGKMLGFHVTVIDDRLSFTEMAVSAGADCVVCELFEKALRGIIGDRNTYFIIVTRGHKYDTVCLNAILKKEYAYAGMMGSRGRIQRVKKSLAEHIEYRNRLEELHAPIGLSICAKTPEEIAVAVMAEVIEVKNCCDTGEEFSKEILDTLIRIKEPIVMVTIVSRKGSAPRGIGSKMLVAQDGSLTGTIGGGCMEAEIRQKAIHMLRSRETCRELAEIFMNADEAEKEGMVCGGSIAVYLETIEY